MRSLGDCITLLDSWYPPALAEEWDAVGLVCGRRADEVARIALAVEVTDATLDWAIAEQAQLLVVHHPLYLRGTTNVDGDSPKGSLIHRAITHGVAILVAHTNADHARPGVSDAIADALGLSATTPIVAHAADPMIGTGRVGVLESPCTLAAFAQRVAAVMQGARGGVRWAGDADRMVHRVAVCGGAGDAFLDAVNADVYVTSDLRHHVALEYLMTNRAALVDVPHAVAESLWLPALADRLTGALHGVSCTVFPGNSEPWSATIA